MAFAKKLKSIVETSAISIGLQLAIDIGIFDALRDADQPLTSHQVAEAKKLKERYVRELLGCLTSATLVTVSKNDEGNPTYYLEEDAKIAIKDHGALCLPVAGVLMSVYPSIKACCAIDGPHGSRYNDELFRYLDNRSRNSGEQIANHFLKNISGLQDRLEKGITVFEFGSGTGRLLSQFAKKFPKSTFIASEMMDSLVTKMKDSWGHIPNMQFEKHDVCNMTDFPSKYDWVVAVDVIHDLPHPLVAMKNARKIVKEDGGMFAFLDMAGPGNHAATVGNNEGALYHAIATFFCIPESFQALDSEAHGPTWAKATAVSMLEQAGFKAEVVHLGEFQGVFVGR